MAKSASKMGVKFWLVISMVMLGAVMILVAYRLPSLIQFVASGLGQVLAHEREPHETRDATSTGANATAALVTQSHASPTATAPVRVGLNAPPCTGRVRLYDGLREASLVAPGGSAGDEAQPVTIARAELDQLVVRQRNGQLCSIRFTGQWIATVEQPELDPSGASNDAPMPNAGGGLSQSDFDQAIHRNDEGHYQLDSDVVRRVLENGGDAITEVELAPAGRGTRLGARTGFYEYLGLREGDVLLSANAAPVETADDLVQAFGAVSARSPLVMKVERGGRALAIHYAAQ